MAQTGSGGMAAVVCLTHERIGDAFLPEGLSSIDLAIPNMRHGSLNEIDEMSFRRSFDEVLAETRAYYERIHSKILEAIENSPKLQVAMMFRRSFVHSSKLAITGCPDQHVDSQVHCGPSVLIMMSAPEVMSARVNTLLANGIEV